MLDPKWTGTAVDRHEMRALKLKQLVRRNFGVIAMFGFSSTMLSTWEAISSTIGVSLLNGGTAGLFWNYLIVSIGLGFVYSSLAELGSMFPTSGGQYFWVSLLAPRPYRRYLSYVTGWLCTITWQTGIAGGAFISATMIQGLFVLNIPTYVYQLWHGTLLTLAFMGVSTIVNTVFASQLPLIEILLVVFHILGIFMFVPVLALAGPQLRTGSGPLTEFYNPGGWSSNGIATMVGMVGPVTSLMGFDCTVHMAEEAKDSSLTVPTALLVGYGANTVLGFFAMMASIYTIGPLDTFLASQSGYPIIDLFYSTTRSLRATNAMTAILAFNIMASSIAALAAASRQLWAFARSGGVPFSPFFAPDHLPHDIPLTSVLASLTIPLIISLVNISSASALGIILSMFNSALIASYLITIACVMIHRLQGRPLPRARYTVKWGVFINAVALIFLSPILVFSFFPSAPHPTPATMNWGIVMVGGPIVFATIYYIVWGRKSFTPPNETVEDYIERYEESHMSSRVAEEKIPNAIVTGEAVEAAEKRLN